MSNFDAVKDQEDKHTSLDASLPFSWTGDELALPREYLSDQPQLDSHATTYYARAQQFQTRVIDRIHGFLDGNESITEAALEELEAHWIYDLKRLTHSKDELNDKHFYRPLQVKP